MLEAPEVEEEMAVERRVGSERMSAKRSPLRERRRAFRLRSKAVLSERVL